MITSSQDFYFAHKIDDLTYEWRPFFGQNIALVFECVRVKLRKLEKPCTKRSARKENYFEIVTTKKNKSHGLLAPVGRKVTLN